MKQFKWLIYTGLLLLSVGCAKNIDVFIPYDTNPVLGDLNTFYNIVRTDSYTTHWNTNESGLLITPKGTRFQLRANSFQLADGTAVRDTIEIEIREIFSKGDMVKNQTPTISNGRLLNSAGEFHIRATQGGQELMLVPDFSIIIQIPNANPIEEMELFYGEEVEGLGVNWIEADENPDEWSNVRISEWEVANGELGFGYEFNITQLNWINCDAYVNVTTSLTETCIELPEIYTNTNTVVYIVFSDINGIMPMIGNPASQRFCQGNLPEGGEVTYIVISHQGSDIEGQPIFHFAESTTTVNNNIIEMIPVEASISEIVSILDSL
jgi:outer membrane protein assembly factor BamB